MNKTVTAKTDWGLCLTVWVPITILAGLQGWLTGDSVMYVMSWFGH